MESGKKKRLERAEWVEIRDIVTTVLHITTKPKRVVPHNFNFGFGVHIWITIGIFSLLSSIIS